MKKLSDYQGDEAIELWGKLMTPIIHIMNSGGVADIIRSQKGKKDSMLSAVGEIIAYHKKDIVDILLLIDDTPINALNLIPRFLNLISELFADPDIRNFFGVSEDEMMQFQSFGSVMENTEEKEN